MKPGKQAFKGGLRRSWHWESHKSSGFLSHGLVANISKGLLADLKLEPEVSKFEVSDQVLG